jgi:group I intron endonuclease
MKYVGATRDLKTRFASYAKIAKSKKKNKQRILAASLRKYGWAAHKKRIIREEVCTWEVAQEWERFYIFHLKTFKTDTGMNLTRGGEGLDNWTDEMRKAQSDKMQAITAKGKNPLHTKKAKKKAIKACRSEAYRANHSEIMAAVYAAKDNHHFDTPVLQKSLDGQHLTTYDSLRKAADATGSRADKISACINGRRQTHNGYLWERL